MKGDITKFVPEPIANYLKENYIERWTKWQS
jgi:hypothetical protein